MWKWMIAALVMATAVEARDLEAELDRSERIVRSVCEGSASYEEYDGCRANFGLLGLFLACLTIYPEDDRERLTCYDDRAGGAYNGYKKVLRNR